MEDGKCTYRKRSDEMADKIHDTDMHIEDCMKRIEAVNNKVKFSAFGKTRKTDSRKAVLKQKNCPECGRLEDRPGPAQQTETQQRSQASMSSQKEENVYEKRHVQVQECSRLEGGSRPAQGLADQDQARLEGDSRPAQGLTCLGQVRWEGAKKAAQRMALQSQARLEAASVPVKGMELQGGARLEAASRSAQGVAEQGHQDYE